MLQLNKSESAKILEAAQAPLQIEKYLKNDEQPAGFFFSEITKADSTLYDAYNLRPYNPDDLYQKKGSYELFDEMRSDEQINAVLSLKKHLILNSDWKIESEDENVKEFLEYNLHERLDELFEKKLYNMLSCLDFGFSLTERTFEYDDIEKFPGKKLYLKSLKTRAPHAFEFDQDEYGNVTQIRQDTSSGKDIELDPANFIHYAYQKEFDNPYGRSEFNIGVYKCWWSKNAIIKFWNIYLERHGSPTAVGTIPKDLIKEQENVKKALKNLQSKTSITVPEGITIDLLEASEKGGDGFEKAIDKYNTLIARSMLIPDLLGYSGAKTSGGSYSLGQKQFDMFYNNIDQERRILERLINKEIINWLVFYNFGKDVKAKFVFEQSDPDRKEKGLSLWLDAIKSSKIPATFESTNWFLNQVNAPEIDEKKFKEIEDEKKAFRDGLANGQNKNDDNTNKAKNDNKNISDAGKVGNKKSGKADGTPEQDERGNPKLNRGNGDFKEYSFTRSLTKYEKKINFRKIDEDISELEEKHYIELGKIFKLAINALVDDIRRKKIIEKKRIGLINQLTLRHESKITKGFKNLFYNSYETGITQKNYNIVDMAPGLDDSDVIQWLNENYIYTSSVESGAVLTKSKGTLLTAIEEGLGVTETMKLLDEALEGWDITKGGIIDKKLRLEMIVRTSISKAYNQAKLQQYAELGDEIVAYQFSAVMDGRTSAVCESLDKKIFKPAEANYYNPPLHMGCRSLLVPLFREEQEEIDGFDTMPATEKQPGGFLKLKKEPKE